MSNLKIAKVINDSIVDGPGLRMVVFTQGCSILCDGCHNVGLQSFHGGTELNINTLLVKYRKNELLRGITITGGEPFDQVNELHYLVLQLVKNKIHTILFTGYTYETLLSIKNKKINEILMLADILIDGPFLKNKKNLNLKFMGSDNQRIIDLKKSSLEKIILTNL